MEPLARYSKRSQGYSLIEVLAALLLMLIVLLALMESVVLYTQTNMSNILRDEAVRVTQDVLYDLRSRGYANAVGGSFTQVRKLRSGNWTFTTNVTVNALDTNNTMKSAVAITSWDFLDSTFTHQASTLIPNQ